MLIGITGKSGSGKSYISKLLSSMNKKIICLNIDEVGHEVLLDKQVKNAISESFGKDYIVNEKVDRKKLGELVFLSREKMQKLTDITWNHMKKIIDKFLLENKDKIIILEWILLPKSCYFEKCDIKILIDVPYEIRLERAMERDSITKEAFDIREKASIDYSETRFDYIIDNSNKDATKGIVKRVYEKSIISREL